MLTLRHPIFQGATAEASGALYKQKEKDAAKLLEELFRRFDSGSAGRLGDVQLRSALADLGLRPHDHQVADMLQRHNHSGDGLVTPTEFEAIVQEAWGRSRSVAFDDRLAELHGGARGHSPIEGMRAVAWVGRMSPVHWVLRLLRQAWPFAVQRVLLMRNTASNPNMDPALMEVHLETFVRESTGGLVTANDLAQVAAAVHPSQQGGLVVRLDGCSSGGTTVYVPLRCLPENAPAPGVFGSALLSFRPMWA